MSDTARAKAREIMQKLGIPTFKDSVESREAWLIETLDAYAAEQTAALRAALEAIINASDGCVGHRGCNHSMEPWQHARRLLSDGQG